MARAERVDREIRDVNEGRLVGYYIYKRREKRGEVGYHDDTVTDRSRTKEWMDYMAAHAPRWKSENGIVVPVASGGLWPAVRQASSSLRRRSCWRLRCS